MHERLPQERKKYKERKYAEFFRQILDIKSGYRESNPLCRFALPLRGIGVFCFFLISVYQIFSGMQIFACFLYQMALYAGSIALLCFRSPATPYLQKKGKLFAQLPLF